MEQNKLPSQNSDEISLGDLIGKIKSLNRYLFSKWLIIITAGIIGSLLGFTYAYFNKPTYTATTTFVLEEEKVGGGALASLGGLAALAGIDIAGGGGLFQGDNIIELYKSRSMIQKTLLSSTVFDHKKQLLIDRYIESNKLMDDWNENPKLKNINFSDRSKYSLQQDSLIGVLVKEINEGMLSVSKPDKKLSIIKVEVKSKDELFSKAFTDMIVSNVNNFYVETKVKKSRANVEILQRQTDSVRAVMNGAIFSAASIVDATPNLNPTRQILRAPIQRSQFSAEANKAILAELVKNLELSKMSLRKEMPLIQVIDEPVLPLQKTKVGKAKGIVLGGILLGFITCIYLVTKRVLSALVFK